jgi:hypothetical protein
MKKCYFCGAEAPEIQFEEKKTLDIGAIEGERGLYSMKCECGASIVYDRLEHLKEMWNYK